MLPRRSVSLGRSVADGRDRGAQEREPVRARAADPRAVAHSSLGGQLHRNRDPDGIVHGHVALYGEGTASDELLQAAKALADREGVVLNSHLGYDLDMAAAMEARWGRPRLAHLADLGVLGPNATFVHMNVIRDGDVEPILASGLTAVWCPLAYLQKGIPLRLPTRIPEMRRRGASVALGTDSARQSTVGDAPFLAVHLTAEAGQPIASEDAIEMATLGAARAAGLDRLLGSLEPGKRADLVVRQRDAVELGPGVEPAHQLVTLGHGPTADTVLVNGRVVLEGGRSSPRQRIRGDRRGAPLGHPDGRPARPRHPGPLAPALAASGRGRTARGPGFSGRPRRPRGGGGGRVPAWRPSARRRGPPAPR